MKSAKVEEYQRISGLVPERRTSPSQCAPIHCEGRASAAISSTFPLLDGDHVTDDAGTGFVHTAPGHGREDFDIWTASTRLLQSRGVDPTIPYTVDENGAFTKDAPGFEGKRVITDKGDKGDANQRRRSTRSSKAGALRQRADA